MISLRPLIRRFSMFPFPLHESSKEAVQSIKDFPLQFYSEIPELLLILSKKNPKVEQRGAFKEGIVKARESELLRMVRKAWALDHEERLAKVGRGAG